VRTVYMLLSNKTLILFDNLEKRHVEFHQKAMICRKNLSSKHIYYQDRGAESPEMCILPGAGAQIKI